MFALGALFSGVFNDGSSVDSLALLFFALRCFYSLLGEKSSVFIACDNDSGVTYHQENITTILPYRSLPISVFKGESGEMGEKPKSRDERIDSPSTDACLFVQPPSFNAHTLPP